MPGNVAIDARDVQNLVNGDIHGDQVGRDKFGGDHVSGNKVTIQIHNTVIDTETMKPLGIIDSDGMISEDLRRICDLVSSMIFADLQRNPQDPQYPAVLHLRETRIALEEFHTLRYTGVLDTRKSGCEMRFSDIIPLIPASPLPEPNTTLRFYTSMRNIRHGPGVSKIKTIPDFGKLKRWLANCPSGLVFVKGVYSTRHLLRDFAADVITMLIQQKLRLIWLLQPKGIEFQDFDTVEVVKQLVFQIMQLNHTPVDERRAAHTTARFREARTVDDWFGLLGCILVGIEQIYIVVDLEALGVQKQKYNWTHRFSELFHELQTRGISTIIKVILMSHRRYPKVGARLECDFVYDISGTVAPRASPVFRSAR
ncbi:hypothetical protein BO78DRAFT_429871 [Aspergillus sclerotiicarbonarius CBS 121057]|uniref:Uncharacterized protein n=1 Tax=Aspergillus sclerotiicarbonarius (strain CBS 121057 / IBT 28362) TaxID=1448318 RepID=A0A319E7X3_ASPSB|nr:hypothetical protein BO78DRAFT_429871 [Aspergillus sclerotiicarbonarius CBS 121057]